LARGRSRPARHRGLIPPHRLLFSYPYRIRVAPQPGNTAGGTYIGTLVASGSSFAGDSKTIPVTMRVTTQPIAQASLSSVTVRLAQGAPMYTGYVSLANLGKGTLAAQSLTSTGQGSTASLSGNLAVLKFDPGSLAAGDYPGSITINSNAPNGAQTVPVDFQLDDAIFQAGDAVSPGDIVALFGEQLLFDTPPTSPSAPLPITWMASR
jgi:hypothetical protein